MVYDGYVKNEKAEIHRSAIMQDFRDNGAAILDFFSMKFVMRYHCVRHYIFYIHDPVISHFLS